MKDKIYYFQEKSNDILDLQDDFTAEEIGIYFILKAAYFKYAGEIKKDNICQRCKFFGDKALLDKMVKIIFEEQEDLLVNKSWLSDIEDIKERSKKRKEAAEERWKKEKQKVANASKSKQKVANLADSDSKNKNDSKNDNDNKNDNKPKFTPPTLQEVKDYFIEKGYQSNAKTYFDYYEANGWKDRDNKQVKNWKQKAITWNSKNNELPLPSNVIEINKIAGDLVIKEIKEYTSEIDLVCVASGAEKMRSLPEDKRQASKQKFNNKKINLV